MLLIPSIDLRDGRCVRLLQGDFAAETRYELEPHELLARYRQLGASWLHLVDLDGARDGTLINRGVIHRLASQRAVRLQVGGGVRDSGTIDELLARGVARVVIGSAAVERRDEVAAWLQRYGPERVCLAFDVRHDADGTPRVHTRGWRTDSALSLWDALAAYADSGVRHVLCTDIERDGALAGPNLALYAQALQRFPHIVWQASGGVASGADLAALAACGVPAAISGKALLEERITREELRPFLPNASFPV
ncbi:MAG TPA: 1-(5-phosphoribosyl)-5-[(5-phosphoribosylamino)methylideneamino] imidazole-4-carboxamide isomerase [Steroidobacteraceae bacterium]|jgi:phosphoribosylformimino-5-aminoimidazole carboxamide ribotide isomerase|nr:1-(5-phosphoribosyl)-5-[(5-phosphoribosylamino)methylideneamino] imidazole-4-carboxamide isomerase [Steroidobacteraceae bacterium]